MLLRKPTHAGGSPTPSAARFFTEIDASVSTYSPEPPNPVPTSPQSKTHAFFSSPFTAAPPSPPLPLRKQSEEKGSSSGSIASRYVKDGERHTPPRSITADFFSTASSLSPPRPLPPPPQSNRRNFLNLDLKDDSRPLMLAGAFASTPTPTEIRDELISDDPNSKTTMGGQSSAWAEASCEPTPKPPSQVYNPARATLMDTFEAEPSASNIITLGTEPDAEVLSASPPSFSYLSSNLAVGQPLSLYPSRPTSALSFHASQTTQETSAAVTQVSSETEALHPADEEELAPGMIIRSFLPSHRSDRRHNASGTSQPPNAPLSLSSASSNSSTYSSNASAAPSLSTTPASAPSAPVPVTLRLNRPLGQGTFSSVWLAEDLSPISLLLRSRKSLKDMKRKSTKDLRAKRLSSKAGEKGTDRRDGKLKSISSLTSTSSLMRRLRGGVSGTRPGGTSASSAGPSAENQPSSAIVSMGRHGTLMPSPFLPPESVPAVPGLPPSLIPGNRTSSSSPSAVSSRTLGLALPAHPHYHSNEEHQRVSSASSAQSVFLEFTDHHLGSGYRSPPPISPNFFPGSDSVPVLTLGVHNNSGGQGASVSRASSLSLKSSESSDEGGSGSSGAGVLRTGSTRSTFSTRSAQDVNTFSPNQDESVSRTSSTRSSVQRSRWSKLSTRLVAVKLTSRGVIEEREKVPGKVLSRVEKMEDEERERERDRTRVSFVREVEVLKHISHPNITPLLSHLTTRTHHLLVLPYLPGGDLLGLVNDEDTWNHLGESTLRRIFAELCKAVGWMHGVGLVHRDIKLENILLTVPLSPASALLADGSVSVPGSAFTAGGGGIVLTDGSTTTSSPTSYSFASSGSMPDSPTSFAFGKNTNMPAVLPTPPHPLVKLTDFGLSRFIDPASPLLTTRCGSEAYAAPELVVGGGRAGVASSSIRSPWFEEDREAGYNVDGYGSTGGYDARETDAWACGVVLYALVARKLPFGEGPGESLGGGRISGEGGGGAPLSPQERKQWLMKIARGEWEWPVYGDDELLPSSPSASADADAGRELGVCKLVCSAGAKRVVQKLLVRDPNRRKRIKDLWDDEWVAGGLNSGSTLDACAVEGLPSGSDAILDASRPQELDYLSPGLPEYSPMSFVPTFSRMGTMPVFPAEFGAESIAKTSSSGSSYDDSVNGDEDLFDNDRRENGEDTGSQTADEEEELEDEEEDGEGWLVDKDGINNIARSEVPR